MGRKILDNVHLGMTWTAWAGAAYGVLKAAGWYQDDYWKFMGETGMAFHFIQHRRACPSAVTVYDWSREHLAMLDRIGVATEHVCIENIDTMQTAALLREAAIHRIRKALDDGFGVVVWAPTPVLEFGIIHGYDDDDQVFFVEGCGGRKPDDPLRYDNLGISEVPFLCYQIPLARTEVNGDDVIRASLQYGLDQWHASFHMHPDYASGRKAYDNMLAYLKSGDLIPFGLGYTLAVYHDARVNLARYLAYVNESGPYAGQLTLSAAHMEKAADLFRQMTALVPFDPTGASYKVEHLPALSMLAEEALALEDSLYAEIAQVLGKEAHG